MALTIEGVPETIPLSVVTDFVRALGVDPSKVRRMTIGLDSVELEVIAGPGVHRLAIRIDSRA